MHPFDKFLFVVEHVSRIHRLTALISLVSLVILVSARIVKPKLRKRAAWITYVPEILIVVVIATCTHGRLGSFWTYLTCDVSSVLTAKFDWDLQGVEILGKVSAGAVHLHFPIHTGKLTRYAVSSEVTSAAVRPAAVPTSTRHADLICCRLPSQSWAT